MIAENYNYLVIGGGFRSIVGAYALAKKGEKVIIVEQGKSLGGFMSPVRWQQYWIDKGPQFFDNFEKQDADFISDMIGDDVMSEIGFSYSSFINGTKTSDFAIPDWRTFGREFSISALADVMSARLSAQEGIDVSFADFIAHDSGAIIGDTLNKFVRKFLTCDSQELSKASACMTTFNGRKLLFDNDLSLDLKKSPLLDSMLAAKKADVQTAKMDTNRYNFYPTETGLDAVRVAMIEALVREKVAIAVETSIDELDISNGKAILTGDREISFDRVFLGCDVRDSEKLLFNCDSLSQKTHPVAEVMHCFEVSHSDVDPAYYMVDYDLEHKASRITNFCNYMDHARDGDKGVILVEQPITKGSVQWSDPDIDQDTIFREVLETGNLRNDTLYSAKSFMIPVTYKAPLVGYESSLRAFKERIYEKWGETVVCPSGTTLTRKETLDDLRSMDII